MKYIFIGILFSLITVSLQAQEIVNVFLDKHGKDEGLKVVSIGKKMFNLMQMDSVAAPELLEAINGLENIQILSSENSLLTEDYYNSAYNLLQKNKNFTELISIDTEEETLIIMIKETKGIVSELVLLTQNAYHFNLISLNGDLNLDLLAKYSQNLGFQNLGELNTIGGKN